MTLPAVYPRATLRSVTPVDPNSGHFDLSFEIDGHVIRIALPQKAAEIIRDTVFPDETFQLPVGAVVEFEPKECPHCGSDATEPPQDAAEEQKIVIKPSLSPRDIREEISRGVAQGLSAMTEAMRDHERS